MFFFSFFQGWYQFRCQTLKIKKFRKYVDLPEGVKYVEQREEEEEEEEVLEGEDGEGSVKTKEGKKKNIVGVSGPQGVG